MAAKIRTQNSKPLIFLFFLISLSILLSSPSAAAARLLNRDFSLAATEPVLNLALPTDKVGFDVSSVKDSKNGRLPCEVMDSNRNSNVNKIPVRLIGRYAPSTFLSRLPKGSVPGSGPSKGTNDVNN
ncbi:conserved hypothetical protein [Ricinus communis]|uniref:Uncharacterized protein n=1 Tax=Ricinus communis TaxID=3988 RepID=B9TAI3_RICCO|nr:conserved hypothetical protein [Ricinus communis]